MVTRTAQRLCKIFHSRVVGIVATPLLIQIGMGRSGKPDIEYRFFDHVRYIDGFVDALGLRDITLVIHDWGSALGFHYAMRHEKNVKGIAFLEAILMPLPNWEAFAPEMQEMFPGIPVARCRLGPDRQSECLHRAAGRHPLWTYSGLPNM